MIGEDLIASPDYVMSSEKDRRCLPAHKANLPLHVGHLSFYTCRRRCPDGQGHKQQDKQNREIEVGPSHFSLASQRCNPMAAPARRKLLMIKALFIVVALSTVRSGHSSVPFVHEVPTFEFLVESAALNA